MINDTATLTALKERIDAALATKCNNGRSYYEGHPDTVIMKAAEILSRLVEKMPEEMAEAPLGNLANISIRAHNYFRQQIIDIITEAVMGFGELLALCRELKGLTLRDVEKKTGISNAMVSQYEKKGSEPSFRNAVLLCDLYGITLERLARTVRR